MPIHLSRPLRRVLPVAAAISLLALPASAGASVPVDLRVVDSDGSILAEQRQYTATVSLRTDPKADCFGPGTGGSGNRVRVRGRTALGAVVDGRIADRSLRPVSVTDAFDFGLGVCGIGDAVASQSGFWYLKQDHVGTATGGDQTKVKRSDEIVWYLDPDFSDPPAPELELKAPPRAQPGQSFEALVLEYADDGNAGPAAGVDVTGASAPTASDGTTQVTIEEGNDEIGELTAKRSGAISDSARICVASQTGDCPNRPGVLIGGSAKRDEIASSNGPDAIRAGRGDDTIDARNRDADEVDCGPGKDRVRADREDRTAKDCEKVRD
jgi:hypothetical protein